MTKTLPSDVLIVFALESEAQNRFSDLNVVCSGVGKINAAYGLTKALDEWRYEKGAVPNLVLNLGSAGSTHFNSGEVINCTDFIQRDFDTTAVGEALYETPYEAGSACLSNGIPFDGYPKGVCGTGDNFATEGGKFDWNVVDMEAYVYAKICRLEKVPFACFKFITDGADGQAAESFEKALGRAAENLRNTVDKILWFHS